MTEKKYNKDDLGIAEEEIVPRDGAVPQAKRNTKTEVAGAGVVGAFLTYLVQNHVADPDLRAKCLYAVPFSAVAIALGAEFVGRLIAAEWSFYYSEYCRKRELRRAHKSLIQARKVVEEIEGDTNGPDDVKTEARKTLAGQRMKVLALSVRGVLDDA